MSYFRYLFLLLQFICSLFAYSAYSKGTLNPKEYGVDKAKDDIERYYILLHCHQDAVKFGKSISYKGINDIHIEIPSDAVSIPLSERVDFCNVNLYVRNKSKEIALFALRNELNSLSSLDGEDIDDANFTKYHEINRGTYLLVIDDGTPWVKNRKGYDYGASRCDIMLVVNGKGENKPIVDYNTNATKPTGRYCAVSRDEKLIKNLHFYRTNDSSEKTYFCTIQNQYNIRLENISITTPEDDIKYGDVAIQMSNCVNVTFNDIKIDGTYSQLKKFGYGLGLNNIYNLKVNRMNAHAKWGVFGTNNMNTVTLKDCDINRFDIHCYGKDITFKRCIIRDLYNQFSSIYGKLIFKQCQFLNSIPILLEPSYNAYTGFDVIIEDCEWHVKKWHSYLIQAGNPFEEDNNRPELNEKCWPNIFVNKLRIWGYDELNTLYLYKIPSSEKTAIIGYVKSIDVSNIQWYGNMKDKPEVKLSNGIVNFDRQIKIRINND